MVWEIGGLGAGAMVSLRRAFDPCGWALAGRGWCGLVARESRGVWSVALHLGSGDEGAGSGWVNGVGGFGVDLYFRGAHPGWGWCCVERGLL